MTKKFLLKYFPPAKTAKLRNDISSSVQMDLETLYDAWERYKDILRRCPHHGLPLWLQVQTFYNGVNPSTRQLIDSTAGGTLNNRTPEAAYEFIEEMSPNNYQWQVIRTKPTKSAEVYNLDAITILSTQVEMMNKKIDSLCFSQAHLVMQCDASGTVANPEYPPYQPDAESEQMNYIGNNFRSNNNPYSNTYNPGIESSIVRLSIATNSFKLKPNTIQMIQQFVQFDGLQDEDPNNYLANFLEFCDTFKINGISDDAIHLWLFPISLRNKAK
ncbi:Retrotransposon gag protein [Gossypium australe]|uniref:Retrotransposon gag protein n=1 Tax=Gossypium australe TaxID=47621 RepID=A0A5B6V8U5_9ROSI|nr:Retrotransposon gag protein [Gossypium australe]